MASTLFNVVSSGLEHLALIGVKSSLWHSSPTKIKHLDSIRGMSEISKTSRRGWRAYFFVYSVMTKSMPRRIKTDIEISVRSEISLRAASRPSSI
jgi:hypothetical protein